jgi:hypothetical protein
MTLVFEKNANFIPMYILWPRSTSDIYFQPPASSQDSPKKIMETKGPAPNPPLTGEAQLKYENDRLKLALAQR